MCDACDSGVTDDPVQFRQWRDQSDAWFRDTIKRYGWAVQFVESEGGSDWAYTVGLSGYGAPELVVYGLPSELSGRLLNALGERIRAGAAPPRDGDEVRLGAGPAVMMFAVPDPGRVIITANRIYGRDADESLAALQVVWPDAHGRWPWEPGCHAAGRQPMPGTVDAWTSDTPSA